MGVRSYMRSVVDRNVVMLRTAIFFSFLRSALDVGKWIASRFGCFTSGMELRVFVPLPNEQWVG